jgi:hypothetical protein
MKTWGSGGTSALGGGEWSASRPGRFPRYPLDRRLGGPQSRSGRCGEEKNLLPLPGIELRPPSPLPVATPTELSWLPMWICRKAILLLYQAPGFDSMFLRNVCIHLTRLHGVTTQKIPVYNVCFLINFNVFWLRKK